MISFTYRNASTFFAPWTFFGEESDLSETLSITVPLSSSLTNSPSISPKPYQTTEPKPIQTIHFKAILGVTFVLAVFRCWFRIFSLPH